MPCGDSLFDVKNAGDGAVDFNSKLSGAFQSPAQFAAVLLKPAYCDSLRGAFIALPLLLMTGLRQLHGCVSGRKTLIG